MGRLKGTYVLSRDAWALCYGPDEQREIAQWADMPAVPLTAGEVVKDPRALIDVDVLFSGWGGPRMDETFLTAAPRLRAVFYAAGDMRDILTPQVFERGIAVSSAKSANSQPVAEYTLSFILLSLKHALPLARQTRAIRSFPSRSGAPGCYGSAVGLVSLGAAGLAVLNHLQRFDLRVLAYDPNISPQRARQMNVELVSLDELFRRADVVSVHTPWLPETEGLIRGTHIASMKQGATFINTARGAVVREREMLEVLAARPDLQAVLDVAIKEPPAAESEMYTLPNLILTPHIAGSTGPECRRMGRYMAEELGRYVAGEPLRWPVRPEPLLQVTFGAAAREVSRISTERGDSKNVMVCPED